MTMVLTPHRLFGRRRMDAVASGTFFDAKRPFVEIGGQVLIPAASGVSRSPSTSFPFPSVFSLGAFLLHRSSARSS